MVLKEFNQKAQKNKSNSTWLSIAGENLLFNEQKVSDDPPSTTGQVSDDPPSGGSATKPRSSATKPRSSAAKPRSSATKPDSSGGMGY